MKKLGLAIYQSLHPVMSLQKEGSWFVLGTHGTDVSLKVFQAHGGAWTKSEEPAQAPFSSTGENPSRNQQPILPLFLGLKGTSWEPVLVFWPQRHPRHLLPAVSPPFP